MDLPKNVSSNLHVFYHLNPGANYTDIELFGYLATMMDNAYSSH